MRTISSAKPNQSSTSSIQSANSANRVRPSMSLTTWYCPCLISHSKPFIISAGYPKCCQTNDLKVAGASSTVIRVFSDVILAAYGGFLCFPSFPSSFPSPSLGSGRLDVAKAHYCPYRPQIEVWIAHKSRETDF